MYPLFKILHIVILGLWLGAMVFFSFFVVLPLLFDAPKKITDETSWLRKEMDAGASQANEEERVKLAERRDKQGRRLAGEILDIVFGTYFPFQAACAAAALFTALFLARDGGRRANAILLLVTLALAGVLVNIFWLAKTVRRLRLERYSSDPAISAPADAAFQTWHNYSLWTDMAGLVCVFLAIILAVGLKDRAKP